VSRREAQKVRERPAHAAASGRGCGSGRSAGAARRTRTASERSVDRPRRTATRSLPVPATPTRRNYYGGKPGPLLVRLEEERRAQIAAAPVELVERDGRIWQLRKLPSVWR
jgi:hypothetical protein